MVPPPETLGDLARELRRDAFVARPLAQASFRQFLASPPGGPSVLAISAPGGSGKTTTLRLFESMAADEGLETTWLDARDIPADVRAAERAFGAALQELAEAPRALLLIDTFEAHRGLERVYRERIFPQTPSTVKVVLAGRLHLEAEWAHDPAWVRLLQPLVLPRLSESEARSLLHARGVPAGEHDALITLAQGHALTLACLASESAETRRHWTPDANVLSELSDPLHDDERLALATLCLGHWYDEADLVRIAGTGSFLPSLARHAFVERVGKRWRLHDLYRSAFLDRFRLEMPRELAKLVRRAIALTVNRGRVEPDFEVRHQLYFNVGFLLRALPPGEGLYDRFHADPYYRDTLRDTDVEPIVAAIERFEDPTSAALAREHLRRFPELCDVLRAADGEPIGVVIWMDSQKLTEADIARDPAAAKLSQLAPLAEGPRVVRWWFTLEGYQDTSAAFAHLTAYASSAGFASRGFPLHAHIVHTPSEASGVVWHQLGFLDRIPELEFELEGHAYTVFGYDFRDEPRHARMMRDVDGMLALAASLVDAPEGTGGTGGIGESAPPAPPTAPPPPLGAQADVTELVTEALRWFRHDQRLSEVRLAAALHDLTSVERAEQVRALLLQAHRQMRPTGRSPEPAELITRAYFERSQKQLAIAADVGLSLGTFRRRLREAVELLAGGVEKVWAEERPQK